jgi:hypothetical protein
MQVRTPLIGGTHIIITQIMIPKGKLLALLLVFTAVGGVAATGAFTTVQADRTANVQAVGDANALLQIVPASNTEFATSDSGQVEINFQDDQDGDSTSSTGVNLDAETLDDNVINITNNGNDDVTVFATASVQNSAELEFYVHQNEVSGTNTSATIENSSDVSEVPSNLPGGNRYVINSESKGVVLNPGDTISVGLYLSTDSTNVGTDNQLFASGDPVTITANATSSATLSDA